MALVPTYPPSFHRGVNFFLLWVKIECVVIAQIGLGCRVSRKQLRLMSGAECRVGNGELAFSDSPREGLLCFSVFCHKFELSCFSCSS